MHRSKINYIKMKTQPCPVVKRTEYRILALTTNWIGEALLTMILSTLLLIFAQPSWGATWIGGDGDWNVNYVTNTNWDWWDYPDAGEDVYIVDTIYAQWKTVNYVNPDYNPTLNNLYIETATTTDNMTTLSQTRDTLTTTRTQIGVNNGCKGAYIQTGGTHVVNTWLVLGNNQGSSGSYDLSGTGSLSASSLTVGYYGNGDFIQSGGSLISSEMKIGHQSRGSFIQTSGTTTVNGKIYLGVANVFGSTIGKAVGEYTLSDGELSVDTAYIGGNEGRGSFTQNGGTFTVTNKLILSYVRANRGTYGLDGGVLSVDSESIGLGGWGLFVQTGGTHTVSGTLTVEPSGDQTSEYSMDGGTLTASSIDNNSRFDYSAGEVTADITNNGDFNLSGTGTRTVTGNVTNASGGKVNVTNTTVEYTGEFTNQGTYISNPSNNYFTDLEITGTGSLAGGVGDNFYISGDFKNQSTKAALWETTTAKIEFIFGTDGSHDVYIAGIDFGAVNDGYSNNFAWELMAIETDNTLNLFDGNAIPGGGMYVGGLLGVDFTGSQVKNIYGMDGLNIYYDALHADNAYLGGLTFDLAGGGHLIAVNAAPVPIMPGVMMLLLLD